MSQATAQTAGAANLPRDPLDMRNYGLEKLANIEGGPWMQRAKLIGMPLGLFLFFYFHLRWCGDIGFFEASGSKNVGHLYTVTGIFFFTLVLWMTEALPSYLTSFIAIGMAIVLDIMPMRKSFSYLGEPVMVLNIASFILASALVVTGLAKRIALKLVLRWGSSLSGILWSFIVLNLILGAFISATSAKTALLLPLFMVIAAMYGAFGGLERNNVGRNLVLQNLLANNVSASAFMTGSAANLLAVQLMDNAGYKVDYAQWLIALLPLAIIQCAISWWTGTKLILPISKEDAKPKLEGGLESLKAELDKLGPMKLSEKRAAVVFLCVLAAWGTQGNLHNVQAPVVAVIGTTVVLLPAFSKLPALGVMNWNQADIPWHMLMFSWGAYVLGGIMESTKVVDLAVEQLFNSMGVTVATPKAAIFIILASLFALTTLVSESKTARTIIMFPLMIATAIKFGYDVVGFCLPMAFLINQVYVLYFNSKPANISYLTNHYSLGESFNFGMIQLTISVILVVLWAQYAMPLMGFNSALW